MYRRRLVLLAGGAVPEGRVPGVGREVYLPLGLGRPEADDAGHGGRGQGDAHQRRQM